jgi:hypothetical protein
MPILLHILTEKEDLLAREIIACQKSDLENKIDVVDLTQQNTDYKKLLEKIFTADSVEVW